MQSKKSAKDMAFDKERAKYRSEIRELQYLLNQKDETIKELNANIQERDNKIRMYKDWIERLLEYTEMDIEEFKQFVDNQKKQAERIEHMESLLNIFLMYRF